MATADVGKQVFCLPGLGRLDDCVVLVVVDAHKREGINARVAGAETAIENDEVPSICLCSIENVSRLDYAVRKLAKKAPAARIIVCLLSDIDPSDVSSASQQQRDGSRSLNATIAALGIQKVAPEASSGTNDSSEGSTLN